MTIFVLFNRLDPPGQPKGAAELAYQLRGGPVFNVLAGLNAAVTPKVTGQVATPQRADRGHVAFADLSFLVDNPSIREDFQALGVPIIVDVHFPFGAADAINAIQPGATDETREAGLDEAARDLWSRPERILAGLAVLREAAAITSPWPRWAALLDGLPTPVVVMPDVVDPRSGAAFNLAFMAAGRIVMNLSSPRRLAARLMAPLGVRYMRKQLEASGIDWKSRMEGNG